LTTEKLEIHAATAKTVALAFLIVALWSVTHQYRGLGGDAELYAVQGMARIHSNLFQDLFLRNTSQDTYSVFSPFYAGCIGLLGLRNAALVLTIAFKVWFFAAAWALIRRLSDNRTAFLAVALLIITVGAYGAYGVFRYAEDWVTARSVGEALVITALALYFRGWRGSGLLVACAGMVVHPLMVLPGVLLLICLCSSLRLSALAAAAGVLGALAIALAAPRLPSDAPLRVMDANWLEVVRERSQFLFLQLWPAADWTKNARPFMSLTLSALALCDPRVRKLCISAMLVGTSGLVVALIGSLIGPVSALLQGQAWRWVWVTVFSSVLLLAPTLLAVRRDAKCGPLCAILMLAAWTIPAIDGAACMACALILWLLRDRINARAAGYLRWVAIAAAALIAAWVLKSLSPIVGSRPNASSIEFVGITRLREILELQVLSIMIIGALTYWIETRRSVRVLVVTSGVLLTATACLFPGTFRDTGKDGTAAEISEFSDWRAAIPPDSNVFVVPARIAPTFAWFTLQRPSYLTVDQSSGVVFSRATALEVRRRSQVLMPLMDPDWRLLSNMRKAHSGNGAASPSTRALTRDRLISLCSDPELNFVVAREDIGFDPMRHTNPGVWKDWNLYDCRHVRVSAPAA